MSNASLRWLMLVLVVLPGAGCSSARYVLRQQDYGVIAIDQNSNSWPSKNRDKAMELMTSHFPQGYEIVKEEEVVVGTVQRQHSSTAVHEPPAVAVGVGRRGRRAAVVVGGPPVVDTVHTVTSEPRTEWRIHYRPVQPQPVSMLSASQPRMAPDPVAEPIQTVSGQAPAGTGPAQASPIPTSP